VSWKEGGRRFFEKKDQTWCHLKKKKRGKEGEEWSWQREKDRAKKNIPLRRGTEKKKGNSPNGKEATTKEKES